MDSKGAIELLRGLNANNVMEVGKEKLHFVTYEQMEEIAVLIDRQERMLAEEMELRDKFKESLINIQGWDLIGPLMSEQGRQLLMICKEAQAALSGKTQTVFLQEYRELQERAEQAEALAARYRDALTELAGWRGLGNAKVGYMSRKAFDVLKGAAS